VIVVEIDVPITRTFPKKDLLPRTQSTLSALLGLVADAVTLRVTGRGPGELLGSVEEELKVETVRGNAVVVLAVYDFRDSGPKEETELNGHLACVITPVGERPPLAWALAVAMAIVAAEAGNGIVIDEYLIWTGERANNPAALRRRLTAPKPYSDPQNAALDLLKRRAVNGQKVLG
jgi:hypothetical protein